MPKRGDDIDALTAVAVVSHLSNVVGLFTPEKYPHPSSRSVELSVVFDAIYLEVGNVGGFRPTVTGLSAEFVAHHIDVGAGASIKQVDYTIVEVQPDGTGLTMMILQRV